MAKYRCTRCGATHNKGEAICRLCGMDLTGEHIPISGPTARKEEEKKRGIGSLAAVGLLLVLLLGALAIAFGIGESDDTVINAVTNVPGVDFSPPSGWEPVEDPEGGLVFSMPGTATQTEVPLSFSTTDKADQWESWILDETQMLVLYAPIEPGEHGDTDRLRLEAMAEDWVAQNGTTVRDSTVVTYRGYPAIDVTPNRWPTEDPRPARALIVLRGEQAVILQVQSIKPALTQFDTLTSSVGFTD